MGIGHESTQQEGFVLATKETSADTTGYKMVSLYILC